MQQTLIQRGLFIYREKYLVVSAYSVTLFDAGGSKLILIIIFVVAVIFVPIIITYQVWSYTLLKDKILKDSAKGYQ